MRRRPRKLVQIDLFPFLSLVLCVTGVQSVILFGQAALIPLAERQGFVTRSRASSDIHQIVVSDQSLLIPDRQLTLSILPKKKDSRWKETLTEYVDMLVAQQRSNAEAKRRLLIEVT